MQRTTKAGFLLLMGALCSLSPLLPAAESLPQRKITVSGKGTVLVAPDQLALSLGVESKDKQLEAAKASCDKVWKSLLAAVSEQGVKAEDQQASQLSIEPEYDYSSNGSDRRLLGFIVRRTLRVTLKDIGRYEALVTGAVRAGANSVSQGEWGSSKISEQRAEARKLALQAAKKKAEQMAAELGQKAGRPLEIIEEQAQAWGPQANVASFAKMGGGVDGGAVPGRIEATAGVSVSFELE